MEDAKQELSVHFMNTLPELMEKVDAMIIYRYFILFVTVRVH